MRAPGRDETLSAALPFEHRSRSIGPGDVDHGPVIVRHATASGYVDQMLAERAAWRGSR